MPIDSLKKKIVLVEYINFHNICWKALNCNKIKLRTALSNKRKTKS